MPHPSIAVVTTSRHTQRDVARALRSGGFAVAFFDGFVAAAPSLAAGQHALVLIDCDSGDARALAAELTMARAGPRPLPVVLLSRHPDRGQLLELLEGHEISHMVAKHGAVRVAADDSAGGENVDEHALLVTCEKLLTGDVFGIEKYLGARVVIRRRTVRSLREKTPLLNELETYLTALECPHAVVPDIVTVAEELLLNAIVHAPRDRDGKPKYEERGPAGDLVLEPHEAVEVAYGCDGQRLMLSVTDNFGGLQKKTVFEYLRRAFQANVEPESKPGGAGLGLAFSLRTIHQLVFNVQDSVRTEAIAGWYLRVKTAREFRSVAKSLNLFWLPADAHPGEGAAPPVCRLRGRIDEAFDLSEAERAAVIDLRDVKSITSRGVIRWLQVVPALAARGVEIVGLPEAFIAQATMINGFLDGVRVKSVMAPYECGCGYEERRETEVASPPPAGGACPACSSPLRFAGFEPDYAALQRLITRA